MKFKNEEELVEWIETMHLQNTSGRETPDQMFRLGIEVAISELNELNLLTITEVVGSKNCGCSKLDGSEIGSVTKATFKEVEAELPDNCCNYIEWLGACPTTGACKKCSEVKCNCKCPVPYKDSNNILACRKCNNEI